MVISLNICTRCSVQRPLERGDIEPVFNRGEVYTLVNEQRSADVNEALEAECRCGRE